MKRYLVEGKKKTATTTENKDEKQTDLTSNAAIISSEESVEDVMRKKAKNTLSENDALIENGLTVIRTIRLTNTGSTLKLCRGSVISFTGECIVNAANAGGVDGGGVDGAINQAGGARLIQTREALPFMYGNVRIPPGQARVTSGQFGTLKCKRIIHVCSADYHSVADRKTGDAIVRSAYKNALRCANDTVAFSLLSAGIYRGDCTLEHVLGLGVEAIVESVQERTDLLTVSMVAFTKAEVDCLDELFTKLARGERARGKKEVANNKPASL